ncbi:putative NRPS-like enzyme [Thelonectria olida]|uniref:NRPS-like enzyme n=1 Tax=Thelonectria olida TaxID=1576542 RepID=A0A9P8WCW2_9HYPO|nr:putative NRPS-like enzyme [Thelonectria olida]
MTVDNHGRRLIINIIDGIAASDPSRPFIFVPRTSNPSDGWKPVSYRQIAQVIDHVAWRITENYGPGFQDTFPTLAFISSNDARYIVVLLACIKAGYQALFLSPRNSNEAQQSLLDKTDCRILWHTDNFGPLVKTFVDETIETAIVPSFSDLLAEKSAPFPYNRTFDQAKWDPVVVLHTSGSTGTPKPVVMRQGSLAAADALRHLPERHGGKFIMQAYTERANRVFIPMPLFHAAGIIFFLSITGLYGTPTALSIADRPLTADLAIECLKYADVQGALMAPFHLEEISKNSESMAVLAKLRFVIFGGGNLGQKAGQTLVDNGVVLSNAIGSTEYCPYPCHFHTNKENWQYFIFNSEAMGCDWRIFSKEDNSYELVIRRNAKGPDQAVFYTFPHLDEWSTKDLYKPHPTLPDHWMYCGRVDDVIVFSNGEKLNPVTMEETIVGHPLVKGALVVGQERFQPALILETASMCDKATAKKIVEEVWPLVEQANAETVAHGRIVKWLVTVASKAFLRTPKGTILRGRTVKLFEKEIASLYEQQVEDEPVELNLTTEKALTRSILDLVTDIAGQDMAADADFFLCGFDSLKVIVLVRMLGIGLEGAGVRLRLKPSVVYENPTAAQLAKCLLSGQDGIMHIDSGQTQLEELLQKHTKNLPSPRIKPEPFDNGQTVVVTGTTGSLGAYLLDRLCAMDTVRKVVALNRDRDGGKSRQPSVSAARGLGTDFAKVEFLAADLALPDFGLGAQFNELLQTVDRVIHNAWPVNFNLGVKSFEPQIRGVRHLVDFSAAAARTVPIVFLSSIGTAAAWTMNGPVPEEPLEDLTLARMGYGQSKLIGSLILDAAARHGVPAVSIRVGQIAGPKGSKGVWNRQEFLPSLIASSAHLGALPDHLGPNQVIDWIPIEDVADIVLDLAGVAVQLPTSAMSGYFHAVNPVATKWSDLVPVIKECYGIREETTLEDWIARLESAPDADVHKNPGVKLLDTYRGMLAAHQAGQKHVVFSMQRTKTRSPTVGRLSGITTDLMRNWCEQWKGV